MKTNYNKSEIMKNAWTIRRGTGCTMSEAMKQAWAIAKAPKIEKTIETLTVEDLTALGGKLWEKGSNRRVYFNSAELMALCNVETDYYKTGNLCGMTFNGEKVSNSYGQAILAAIKTGVYYDLNAKRFDSRYTGRGLTTLIDCLTDAVLAA